MVCCQQAKQTVGTVCNYTKMTNRFEPSQIKNKIKREEIAQKKKKAKNQEKLKKRLALAKAEANDPAAKKVCGVLELGKTF